MSTTIFTFSWRNKRSIMWIPPDIWSLFVCVEILWPSQPYGVMLSSLISGAMQMCLRNAN